jgi:hypothetical protein
MPSDLRWREHLRLAPADGSRAFKIRSDRLARLGILIAEGAAGTGHLL